MAILRKVGALEEAFVRKAELYGKIIISERFLPLSQKTIKPLDIGGRAGGIKVPFTSPPPPLFFI